MNYFPKWPMLIVWLGVCLCSETLLAQHKPETEGKKFATVVEGYLASVQSSTYQHKTEIDEKSGKFNCDCSALIGYSLSRHFPEHLLAVDGVLAPWKFRALAVTFYETFERAGEKGNGLWQIVPRLEDARAGDIIAWRRPKSKLEKGKTTGHVCMLAETPKLEADGRYLVRIVDSTKNPHENDTRKEGENGFGSGEMWFEVDQAGRPISYWKRKDSSRVGSNLILIGRLMDGNKVTLEADKDDLVLIGKSERRAAEATEKNGLRWRVIKRDGVVLPIHFPSRKNYSRVNVVIEKGKVVRVTRG